MKPINIENLKLGILFVDDDNSIINGIRRMMYSMQKEWNLLYANGGQKALEILEEEKIDIIISDIRMPGIDGTQLLTVVKEKYPHIIRITLSGYASDDLALRNTRIVHQSLPKPTTPEKIKSIIEKAFKLRSLLHNDELQRIVSGIDNLPSLPEIYLKLEAELNTKNSSIDKLSKIISSDPVITAKILQLSNSAFFGMPNRISNLTQALNFLGIKIVQNLVLTIKLFKSFDPNHPSAKLYESIWNHSHSVATIAKKLGSILEKSSSDIEDSYVGGLLHDLGKIILLENSSNLKFNEQFDILDENDQISNVNHADIGAYLLGIWGLPDTIVEATAYHHTMESVLGTELIPAKLVSMANNIANNTNLTYSDITKENINDLLDEYGVFLKENN